jgi:integrase
VSERNEVRNDIQWRFSEEFTEEAFNGLTTNKVFEAIKRIDKLPIFNGDINFSSDLWDLSEYILRRVPKRKSCYKFEEVHYMFKEQIKFFTLMLLWNSNSKIQRIYNDIAKLKKFLEYLTSEHIYSIEYLSVASVKKFISTVSDNSPHTVEEYKMIIKRFFQFYSNNYNTLEWVDIFKYLDNYNSQECKAHREANKWPNIPKDYINRLIICLTNIMRDKNASIDERGIAAEIILLSQTGLRNNELCDCTINSVEPMKIFDGNEMGYYLNYYVTKNAKGDLSTRDAYSVINELAYEAYNILTAIYNERRTESKSDLLFTPMKARTLPVTENTLDRMLTNLLLKYGNEVGCINTGREYPELKTVIIGTLKKRKACSDSVLSTYNDEDTLSIPRPHQFRVHLCTELYLQGVPLIYIQKHMAHLSKEMASYYIRPQKDMKKEREYAESIMKTIMTGELTILGEKADTLILKINDYIKKTKLNVEKDLNEIVSKLTKRFPIRAKCGGVCIKSGPIRDCSKSDITDELFCAYGMCPNNFHVYYMVDITYDKYNTLLRTMQYNKECGLLKAFEKEKNKLIWIVNKYLIPELDELRKEIFKKGASEVINEHNQLSWFIDNFNSIYKEVLEWKN